MCGACKVVLWHVNQTMTVKHPKARNWKESELLDVYDEICKPDTFDGYGIKLINGENVLGGPALQEEQEKLAPGQASIQMGGDSWKKRLAEECRKMVYENYGEEEIYEAFKKKELSNSWCYENEVARKKYSCKATKAGKKDGKKVKKDKKKKEKKEKKDKKPKNVGKIEKKLSVEAYIRNLAAKNGIANPDKFMYMKTEGEWAHDLKKLLVEDEKPGSDEL